MYDLLGSNVNTGAYLCNIKLLTVRRKFLTTAVGVAFGSQ